MTKKWILGAILGAALVIPGVAHGHQGHAHKVMGTVSAVDGNHLILKTTDGKTATVMLDAKTKITRGTAKLTLAELKVGDRVVAEGMEDKSMIMATTVQVGTAPAAKK